MAWRGTSAERIREALYIPYKALCSVRPHHKFSCQTSFYGVLLRVV